MAEATPLSIRVDSDLKSAVDTSARAQGMSTTEFIERALKTALHTTCATCGRSSLPNATTPGFSPQFETWIAQQKQVAVNQPILITTVENGAQWVYWVKLRDAAPMESGMLMVKVFIDTAGTRGQDMAIPRGNIVGWREDGERRWYDNQLLLGFHDGNGRVVRRLIEAEQARRAARPVTPGRSGRGRSR